MAMGKRKRERQQPLFLAASEISEPVSNHFYDRLNAILEKRRFDKRVEHLCRRYYRPTMGRPSISPGTYFRMLFIGYFEGIDSERGIAWRAADSLSLRRFLGYLLNEVPPDHSTISRTRRLYSVETHAAVFRWVNQVLVEEGLLEGQSITIDATTLEANAAMRSIVRRDSGLKYEEWLRQMAKADGLENPTRQQLARWDRKRKKKAANAEWKSATDADARIAKMKDGRTHLAHKAEHAVDLSSGALVAVTLQAADKGDTSTLGKTLRQAQAAARKVNARGVEELVCDRGYHSGAVLKELEREGVRSYLPEPERGRRNWEGKRDEQRVVYGNRRRVTGERGQRLQKKRGELVERSFAHMYETGGMRRVHLRGRDNIFKRLIVHAGAFNLGLLMRQMFGTGAPRQWKRALLLLICAHVGAGRSNCKARSQPSAAPLACGAFRSALHDCEPMVWPGRSCRRR
jgi:transposase